jgi:hypothetical protein
MWAKKTSTIASAAISGDITAWKLKVQNSILSNAAGEVTQDAGLAGLAIVTVTWRAPSKLSSENDNKYETSVFVQ